MSSTTTNPKPGVRSPWPASARCAVSALIFFHLFAVVYTPLTLDRGFDSLLGRLHVLRDYAAMLYLDNGYRFFAPDPGPTHTLRIELGERELKRSIRLPDQETTWPRLLYHRWFMLGETIANSADVAVVGATQFHDVQNQLSSEINSLMEAGHPSAAQQLKAALDDNQRQFDFQRSKSAHSADGTQIQFAASVSNRVAADILASATHPHAAGCAARPGAGPPRFGVGIGID